MSEMRLREFPPVRAVTAMQSNQKLQEEKDDANQPPSLLSRLSGVTATSLGSCLGVQQKIQSKNLRNWSKDVVEEGPPDLRQPGRSLISLNDRLNLVREQRIERSPRTLQRSPQSLGRMKPTLLERLSSPSTEGTKTGVKRQQQEEEETEEQPL